MAEPTLLSGVVPILVVPVARDDAVLWDDLAREVEFLAGVGVPAVSFGFGSEVFRLTEAERDEALAVAVSAAGGRVGVIAHVLAGSTAAAIDRVTAAKALGADAAMLPAPIYATGEPDALFAYFSDVVSAVDLPVVVQDAPGMVGVEIPAPILVRLARDLEAVVALKIEAEPSAPKVGAIAAELSGEAAVLGGGHGRDLVHELERGADGTMPGPGVADAFVAIRALHVAGRRAEARAAYARLLPLIVLAVRSLDTFLFVEKEILRRRGVISSARLRLPAVPPEAALVAELDALLAELVLPGPFALDGGHPVDRVPEVT